MNRNAFKKTSQSLALLLAGLSASAAFAAAPVSGGGARNAAIAQEATVSLSPAQRGQLAREFVRKWGHYVQRVYKTDVGTWSRRMVPQFTTADSDNLRSALKRNTFEGALAALGGSGHRMSDEQVITKLAKEQTAKANRAGIKTLGSLANDLVYTPIAPCRIVDTRSTPAGPIAENATRNFVSINQANFTSQGGSSSDCGTQGLNATAVALNVTAVTPTVAGYATVFPFGSTRPLAATVNYVAGDIRGNAVIAQIPNPLSSSDFSLYTYAQSDYVVDIVGYFAPPQATALQCTSTFVSESVAPSGGANTGIFDIQIPSCPAGYGLTGAGCRTPGFDDVNWAINGLFRDGSSTATFCSGLNRTAGTVVVEGTAQCCRVPGR
jgi:hypothetical protein